MIIRHIEEKAEMLLKKNGFYKVGFDVEKLVNELDVELVKKDFGSGSDISGLLAVRSGKVVISVNKSENIKRQRFTIAHELGHFVLHSKEQPLFVDKTPKVMYRNNASTTGEILKEREANAFAAALLMPRDLISDAIENCDLGGDDIVEKLARDFNVSEQAMSFRLSNLGYYLEFM